MAIGKQVLQNTNYTVLFPILSFLSTDLIASYADPSKSTAEGNGLQEAEIGAETDFNVTTRDSEGKLVYREEDQVTAKIRSPNGE